MICNFCHQDIPDELYFNHVRAHTNKLSDGQQVDHVTVAPTKRYQGSLDGVPQVYRHRLCGGMTQMPEEIIRSYLVNPFLYNGTTFCTRCKAYVRDTELFWTETGQRLSEYRHQLQAGARSERQGPGGFTDWPAYYRSDVKSED